MTYSSYFFASNTHNKNMFYFENKGSIGFFEIVSPKEGCFGSDLECSTLAS